MGNKKDNKENEAPSGNDKKRCRWDTASDATLCGQLLAEKAAGNQTDNAGWHSATWTACALALKDSEKKSGGAVKTAEACQTRWGSLKAQYQLVKSLRNKSGWGWDDEKKHIVVSDEVWNAYLAINGKIRPWRYKGFPLYDEMSQLVDGAVATGEGAFIPGQGPNSPPWGPIRDEDDEDNSNIDPILLGPEGHVEPLPRAPATPAAPATRSDDENSDMDDITPPPTQSRRRVRAVSDSSPSEPSAKRTRTDGHRHGRKPSNGHALMAVSESLQGIAAALKAESTGPSTPQRKTAAIKVIMTLGLEEDEEPLICRLIRSDVGIADVFLAIPDTDTRRRIAYLRSELEA